MRKMAMVEMNKKCKWGCVIILSCLLMSCSGDDDYHYPSVQLEFLTAYSNAEGKLQSVLTDEGKLLSVVEDLTNSSVKADTAVRIVSYYEKVTDDTGAEGGKLYAVSQAISSVPLPTETFTEGVKTKASEVMSSWLGYNYLNVVLTLKQQGQHTLGFVEEEFSIDSSNGCATARVMLYHDATSDVEDYTKRAYLSIPLKQYLTEEVKRLFVYFSLYTDSETVETYEFTYEAG